MQTRCSAWLVACTSVFYRSNPRILDSNPTTEKEASLYIWAIVSTEALRGPDVPQIKSFYIYIYIYICVYPDTQRFRDALASSDVQEGKIRGQRKNSITFVLLFYPEVYYVTSEDR